MRLSPAEDANRRLLRARDAIDRHFAEPLDIPALARVALGFEVTNDVDMGFTRWLTVALPHDPDRHLLLEVPGPPALSEEVAGQVRDVLTKGALGVVCVLTTDDCHKAFAQLSAQGWSSPRSRPSSRTASTARCATRSATRSGSTSTPDSPGSRHAYGVV